MNAGGSFDRNLFERRALILHEQHSIPLAKYAMGLGASAHEATEAADEAVIRLAKGEQREHFEPPGSELGWLFAVVKHLVADLLRRRALEQACDWEELADHVEQTSFPTPEEQHEATELLQALRTLPEAYQSPIILTAMGYSAKEIGTYLNLSEEAIWQRVARGRKKLYALTERLDTRQNQSKPKEGGVE